MLDKLSYEIKSVKNQHFKSNNKQNIVVVPNLCLESKGHKKNKSLTNVSKVPMSHRSQNNLTPQINYSKINRNQKICQNHKNKIAKYIIVSDEQQLLYCQKCAIFLASQGFGVQKIIQNNLTDRLMERENSSNELQIHVDYVLKNLENKYQSVNNKILELKEIQIGIKMNMEQYFNKVIDFILDKKKQFRQFIQIQQNKLVKIYQEQQIYLQKSIFQVNQIKQEAISSRYMNQNQKLYLKNQIKKYRIMCEKLNIQEIQTPIQFITTDIQDILNSLSKSFNIKIWKADQTKQFSFDESGDQKQIDKDKMNSILQSEINKVNQKHSLFSCEEF